MIALPLSKVKTEMLFPHFSVGPKPTHLRRAGRTGRAWGLIPALPARLGWCWREVGWSRRSTAFSQRAYLPVAEIQESCQDRQRPAQTHTGILKGRWNAVTVNARAGNTMLVYWSFSKHTNPFHVFMSLSLCSVCLKHPHISEEMKSHNLTQFEWASRVCHYTLQVTDRHQSH